MSKQVIRVHDHRTVLDPSLRDDQDRTILALNRQLFVRDDDREQYDRRGVHYQRCGGGRRVIRKRIGRE